MIGGIGVGRLSLSGSELLGVLIEGFGSFGDGEIEFIALGFEGVNSIKGLDLVSGQCSGSFMRCGRYLFELVDQVIDLVPGDGLVHGFELF